MGSSTGSHLRTAACWLTVAMTLWSLSYYFAYGTKEGSAWIIEDLTVPLISQFDISWENGARLVMLIAPLLIVTSICNLIVTTADQPSHMQRSINAIFVRLRGFSGMAGDGLNKRNQFALGEVNFDWMAFFLVTMPVFWFFVFTLDQVLDGRQLTQELRLKAIGNAFGMAGTLALSFFLIPVARHSVLLVAMGWSPLQALRFHIWAGYTSFACIALHGIIHFIVWTRNQELNVWEQIWPASNCWEWNAETKAVPKGCRSQWYNLTGVIAAFFMLVLILTSINWFRRRYYRIFYICHVICAIGMIAGAAMHWRPIITFLAPSIIYYLASTMPALVQAVASRARGGVRLVKVVHLKDAGGCKEIHVSTTHSANVALDNTPSMFVKMCVPGISMIWHPFTVFKHPRDPSTVRILFRPVGTFTKQLASRYEEQGKNTPTVLDGFYHAGNRTLEALHHDHVTFYCGGVAITPFLSLIPHLIAEIAQRKLQGLPILTRKLVFYWACREEGLASYITENYLKGMKRAANAIDFEFDCVVYHTKRKVKSKPSPLDPSSKDFTEDSNVLDTTFMSDLTMDDMRRKEGLPVDWHSRRSVTEYDDDGLPRKILREVDVDEMPNSRHDLVADEASVQPVVEVTEYASKSTDTHAMELHRFMPARHATVWRNVYAFLVVGGSLWLFFYIIFYYYNGYEITVHEFYDRLWPLILCLMASIVLALVFEGVSLASCFLGNVNANEDSRAESSDSHAYLPVDEEHSDDVLIEHRGGRPDIRDIFADPQRAECPGIFMCGPPAMTEKVRAEANKENSIFGLTRYALYEDPFEM
ncbi:Ferric reduction oxidase [Seminavis robusta]|uniref:Ferric reduction oxidase n=1 Tax=Seminavis robusta TaxID=568900 RepID=A0A9N8DPV0_9STRA|nr:Ferric reduction oxidase [Seminavis robusta]|eukprot:Sro270_g104170.1 Ferric reduction oxidase (815) ;mRNA; f:8789-11357